MAGTTDSVALFLGRPARRRLTLLVTVLMTVVAVFLSSSPAFADPDEEGATAEMAEKLRQVAEGYYTAKAQLSESQKRQAQAEVTLRDSQLALSRLSVTVGQVAAARYEGQQLNVLTGLFSGNADPRSLLQGAAVADYLLWQDDEQIRQYRQARDSAEKAQADLDGELKLQARVVVELDNQKRLAEKALASVGGMVTAGYSGPAQPAQPSPRNADGSWPREGMSVKDPSGTGGSITPRMLHTLYEAQLAGFTRYTRCWRSGTFAEHPKGRACDFSAMVGNFGGTATGDDKAYGTRLATWGVANAEALGIMYVIWFRQIWMPGIGWRAYQASGTDPSAQHENHVHISVL